ncbi:MAG TPA: SiaB family protein kinase [Bacteroidales bacterium]|nr:SiaB family protein kinase [Bacteroidales bacterium]
MDETTSKVILEYRGIVSFNVISALLPKLKENIDALGEKVNTYKRLLTITIEVLENCYRYIDNQVLLKDFQQNYPSFIKVYKQGPDYCVESGNTILQPDVDIISKKLDAVNSLDEQGLRDFYKKTIANGQFSEVGGAGLGFIEIAKACSGKISYHFDKVEKDVYFYTLKLIVNP